MLDEVVKFARDNVSSYIYMWLNRTTYNMQLRVVTSDLDYSKAPWGSLRLRTTMANHITE